MPLSKKVCSCCEHCDAPFDTLPSDLIPCSLIRTVQLGVTMDGGKPVYLDSTTGYVRYDEKRLSIDDDVPEECPFHLEHLMETQNEDKGTN